MHAMQKAGLVALLAAFSLAACSHPATEIGASIQGGTSTSAASSGGDASGSGGGTGDTGGTTGGTSGVASGSSGGMTGTAGATTGAGTTGGTTGRGSSSGGTLIGGTGGACHAGDAGANLQDPIALTFYNSQRYSYVPMISVAVADFDGDGHPDLLAGGVLLFGMGDGTFTTFEDQSPAIWDFPSLDGWPVDLDGDGLPDLVTAETAGSAAGVPYSRVAVFLNGGGYFRADASSSLTLTGMQPSIVAVGDLDGDGAPDLILQDAHWNGGDVPLRIVLGNRDGTFRSPLLTAPSASACSSGPSYLRGAGDIQLGDVNGDGVPDIVQLCSRPAGPMFSTFLGVGDGTFGTPIVGPALGNASQQTPYVRAAYFVLGDLDGDGHLDIVESDAPAGQVGLFLGKGDGTFRPARTLVSMMWPGPLATADLNGDGALDVVVAGSYAGSTLLLGRGDGTFEEQAWPWGNWGAHGYPAMAIADVNSDGRPDFLIGSGWIVEEGLSCTP